MNSATQEKNILNDFEDIPKSIGAYDIKETINSGEYSKIYLGTSKYTTDKVAIKIISKLSFDKKPDNLFLTKNEIEALKILKHRNILTLYEIYESKKYIFIITEYLPKELSNIIITKKRLSETDAQQIFIQLVDALQYMHKLQICHRDICLEHIMLDSNNIPKLIDFGFSSFYKKGEQLKEPLGSLSYLCPEIIQENSYDPEQADVWSLGVCLYVMICGYLPFSEEDDNKNRELIISGKIEFPNEVGNICKDLIKKMLDVDPKKRLNLLKITRHPWTKGCKDIKIIGGYELYNMIYPIDERLINIIKQYDIDTNKLEQDLKNNKYNCSTALYKIITKKTLSLGYGTISDFTSNAFVEYMKNKDKIIPDGNKKYQEYLDKIFEKNNSIKKNISEYKEKQKSVIKQLDELNNGKEQAESKPSENKKEESKTNEIKENTKNNEKENKAINENNKEIKEETKKKNDEKRKSKKKEMRFSISFDDDEEGNEQSDNESNKSNDDNKSNESKENEKETSIKEEKEETIEKAKEEEKKEEIVEKPIINEVKEENVEKEKEKKRN